MKMDAYNERMALAFFFFIRYSKRLLDMRALETID